MSDTSRPRTPTFRFGQAGNPDHTFTFADGWVNADSSTPRQPSGSPSSSGQHLFPSGQPIPPSGHHLSPSDQPGARGASRARSASPQQRWDDPLNHAFASANGQAEPSPSAFEGFGALLGVLPPSAPSTPTARQTRLLSAGANDGARHVDNPERLRGRTTPAAYNFGDHMPMGFSVRLLHNATPLPSPESSPQPATSSLALAPRCHTRDRTSDVSSVSGLEEGAPPYDVRCETVPAHRFFSAAFQSTLQAGMGIARDTRAVVEKLQHLVRNDKGLKKLLDDANELCAFEGSDTRTIAVLGDSGQGIYARTHTPCRVYLECGGC
jgi:hypothetical protein